MIVRVGFSHRTAPVEVREQLAVRRDDVPALLDDLLRGAPIAEVAVLSTCNRVEVYAALPRNVAPEPGKLDEAARAIVGRLAARGGSRVGQALARHHGSEAVRHLFRVASSLDSLVVGEPQILGQLKDAVQVATDHGSIGASLGRALRRALFVGKRVRSETQIGAGQVSVSSVAVDLAAQIFGDLRGRCALLVGAGEMAESAAKLLVKQGGRLIVVNRSRERADKLAAEFGGEARDFAELNWALIEADIVVTSTSSPTFVVTAATLKTARKARRGRSLFLIDIAVPRDVEPAVSDLDGVYLYDIDDLEQIVADSHAGRSVEAERAEAIVEAEVALFESRQSELSMGPVIVGLRARVRATLVGELERSLSGKLKHLGEEDKEALAIMIDAATNKICHRPTAKLKALAKDPRGGETVEVLRDLFDLPETIGGDEEAPPDETGSIRPAGPGAASASREEPS